MYVCVLLSTLEHLFVFMWQAITQLWNSQLSLSGNMRHVFHMFSILHTERLKSIQLDVKDFWLNIVPAAAFILANYAHIVNSNELLQNIHLLPNGQALPCKPGIFYLGKKFFGGQKTVLAWDFALWIILFVSLFIFVSGQ